MVVRVPRCLGVLLLGLTIALGAAPRVHAQTGDADGDGLNDVWELQFGLDPGSAAGPDGRDGDPDNDGVVNADEQAAGTHPRGLHTRSFAEGSTGSFFDTRIALFNTSGTTTARVLVRFLTNSGTVVSPFIAMTPLTRTSIDPETIAGLESTAFSTVVESDVEIVADRTMWWNGAHYGSHAETGVTGPSLVWFLAEGATHSGFDLFYLLQNPGRTAAAVTVTYLLPRGAPIERSYSVPPQSRMNVWVDLEDPALASTDVSATITSSVPIVVERAMYLNAAGQTFGAGHASAGITAPALEWYLAEGATGSFFDLFVLIANPDDEAAAITVTFLLPDGSSIDYPSTVGPRSRFTLWVDTLDPRLASTPVSTVVRSTNDVPVIVERAMWWPGSAWFEAHNSAGAASSGAVWALAEGEVGGAWNTFTYVLVANTGHLDASVELSLYFQDGGTDTRQFHVAARSRATYDIAAEFPGAFAGGRNRRFATVVQGMGSPPPDLIVERAMYSDANGVTWAAGTNALGTRLAGGIGTPPASPQTIVAISPSDPNAMEQGIDRAVLQVTRSSAQGTLVVPLIVSGSADVNDIGRLPHEVVFPPGQTTATVVVTPADDSLVEPEETVVVTLAAGPTYTIGLGSAAVRIVDNDVAGGPAPSLDDAARFLAQATFGPTLAEIERVRAIGYDAWITEQIGQPRSGFLAYLDVAAAAGETISGNQEQEAWFQAATAGPDQLRQRVANALLEILVVGPASGIDSYATTAYMDVLMRDAFGNFRTILEDVTLSATMGEYLDMLRNQKEDSRTGRIPNENYARELLQLFSIGVHELNRDGTVRRDGAGNPIDTYGQEEIAGFSRVFTGWTTNQPSPPTNFYYSPTDWRNPMVQVVDSRTGLATRHSTSGKPLLGGVALPATSGTATVDQATSELRAALDNVFAHPNVGPFIGRQLIQRLVTGHPSPAYVDRVAAAFDDNGAGVRGDLRAVVRAILLDAEARDASTARNPYFGHLREPMIRYVTVLRAFGGRAQSGKFKLYSMQTDMGQAPFRSPSVFNFFAPDYRRPGEVADAGVDSPEFQITSETTVVRAMNTMRNLVYRNPPAPGTSVDSIVLDLQNEQALAGNADALIDRLDALLFAGGLSAELRGIVRDAVNGIQPPTRTLDRARSAVYLLVTSPEFVVQK